MRSGSAACFAISVAYLLDRPDEASALLRKRFPQVDDRQFALAMADTRKITPRDLMLSPAGFENAERFNIAAGLLKPEEKLKSYDNLFTDEFAELVSGRRSACVHLAAATSRCGGPMLRTRTLRSISMSDR